MTLPGVSQRAPDYVVLDRGQTSPGQTPEPLTTDQVEHRYRLQGYRPILVRGDIVVLTPGGTRPGPRPTECSP